MQPADIGRILGIMLAIGIVVFVVVQIANFARNSMDSDDTQEQTLSATDTDLSEYANDASRVTLTIDGRIVPDEDHRHIRFRITESFRILEITKGYDEEVIKRQRLDNTPGAYSEFLQALDYYGYTLKQVPAYDNEVGVCPDGFRMIYELTERQEQVVRSWYTTCSKRFGDFAGNEKKTRALFKRQFPNYSEFTADVTL